MSSRGWEFGIGGAIKFPIFTLGLLFDGEGFCLLERGICFSDKFEICWNVAGPDRPHHQWNEGTGDAKLKKTPNPGLDFHLDNWQRSCRKLVPVWKSLESLKNNKVESLEKKKKNNLYFFCWQTRVHSKQQHQSKSIVSIAGVRWESLIKSTKGRAGNLQLQPLLSLFSSPGLNPSSAQPKPCSARTINKQ